MSEYIYKDPADNYKSNMKPIIEVGEVINFPDWKIFEGDAGSDPFFELRMKGAIVAMAKFLDYIDQTETYQYYPYGRKMKDNFSFGLSSFDEKQAVLQLAKHGYFFEKESTHPKTIFQNKDWIRVTLNEIDLWPNQIEIQYERFLSACSYSTDPIFRRVEIMQVMALYEKKIEKFSFQAEKEWAHLWNLVVQEYNM